MDSNTSLQIPDSSTPGPSSSSSTRNHTPSRPVSAAVHSATQPTTTHAQSGSRADRKRASHNVISSQPQESEEQSTAYPDVYSHPAAVAYAAAHPRRAIPKFGPYLLLQTLGEGEFGKVKLGLHSAWGEEVAVKLIRRGNIDTSVRMSKVEREIEVLRTIKHPNIVRLYDVIETDKYIGIILEYASGGELFDHILAHRYLKEKDACKLFSQLISGVWYIHQKKIVHRDLKLENLLLDRHRNVIITDFGFANRFEHRADDLMQTSCGSPCYAAPELVISEGLYVGSAVDIWSCGVILYAMLAGYLPFDDDPANPDGDNINLLYKYIVNTPLTFPDYISTEARDLLSMMLVPDPQRRADLPSIMAHNWLAPYKHLFSKSIDELERAAMEQHQLKRLAYQRQMKQTAQATDSSRMVRSQSARTDVGPIPVSPSGASTSRSRSHRDPHHHSNTQPLYETSPDQSMYSPLAPTPSASRRGASVAVMPASHLSDFGDDPFAAPSNVTTSMSPLDSTMEDGTVTESRVRKPKESTQPVIAPVKLSPDRKKKDDFRHTIQVEYEGTARSPPRTAQTEQAPAVVDVDMAINGEAHVKDPGNAPSSPVVERSRRKASVESNKPLPPPPTPPASVSRSRAPLSVSSTTTKVPVVSVEPSSPVDKRSLEHEQEKTHIQSGSGSTGSVSDTSSTRKRHKKGMSMDKFGGLSKLWGSSPVEPGVSNGTATGTSSRVPSDGSSTGAAPLSPLSPQLSNITAKVPPSAYINHRPATLQTPVPSTPATLKDEKSLSADTGSVRKSRRATFTGLVVDPLKPKQRSKGKPSSADSQDKVFDSENEKREVQTTTPVSTKAEMPMSPLTSTFQNVVRTDVGMGMGMPASTGKARKVMQWFRSRSKGRMPSDANEDFENITGPEDTDLSDAQHGNYKSGAPAASMTTLDHQTNTPVVIVTPTPGRQPGFPSNHPVRTASQATNASFGGGVFGVASRVVSAAVVPARAALRIHHGAVDQTTITTGSPPEVIRHVREVLEQMGIETQKESEYKYRCIRAKRRKSLALRDGSTSGGSLAAFQMVGSAASNGVDKRGLPIPSHGSFSGTGGMLRGLLMRRQSSQVSASGIAGPSQPSLESDVSPYAPATSNTSLVDPSASLLPSTTLEPIYGDRTQDQGDEVRFSVELTRIDRLDDTFSLDIRRLKGHLRSYKFLYDTLRERCDLQR